MKLVVVAAYFIIKFFIAIKMDHRTEEVKRHHNVGEEIEEMDTRDRDK